MHCNVSNDDLEDDVNNEAVNNKDVNDEDVNDEDVGDEVDKDHDRMIANKFRMEPYIIYR